MDCDETLEPSTTISNNNNNNNELQLLHQLQQMQQSMLKFESQLTDLSLKYAQLESNQQNYMIIDKNDTVSSSAPASDHQQHKNNSNKYASAESIQAIDARIDSIQAKLDATEQKLENLSIMVVGINVNSNMKADNTFVESTRTNDIATASNDSTRENEPVITITEFVRVDNDAKNDNNDEHDIYNNEMEEEEEADYNPTISISHSIFSGSDTGNEINYDEELPSLPSPSSTTITPSWTQHMALPPAPHSFMGVFGTSTIQDKLGNSVSISISSDGAYLCPVCEARFSKKSDLTRHYDEGHLQDVRKCYLCGEVLNLLAFENVMATHLSLVHSIGSKSSKSSNVPINVDNISGLTITNVGRIKEQQQRQPQSSSSFMSPVVQSNYPSSSSSSASSSGSPYKCKACEKTFIIMRNLATHYTTTHHSLIFKSL